MFLEGHKNGISSIESSPYMASQGKPSILPYFKAILMGPPPVVTYASFFGLRTDMILREGRIDVFPDRVIYGLDSINDIHVLLLCAQKHAVYKTKCLTTHALENTIIPLFMSMLNWGMGG